MSGGHFEYQQYRLENIALEIESLIRSNGDEALNEWGDRIGRHYSEETVREFKTAVHLLRQAGIYAHRIDWLVSGDDDEESFHEQLAEDLEKLEKNEMSWNVRVSKDTQA